MTCDGCRVVSGKGFLDFDTGFVAQFMTHSDELLMTCQRLSMKPSETRPMKRFEPAPPHFNQKKHASNTVYYAGISYYDT